MSSCFTVHCRASSVSLLSVLSSCFGPSDGTAVGQLRRASIDNRSTGLVSSIRLQRDAAAHCCNTVIDAIRSQEPLLRNDVTPTARQQPDCARRSHTTSIRQQSPPPLPRQRSLADSFHSPFLHARRYVMHPVRSQTEAVSQKLYVMQVCPVDNSSSLRMFGSGPSLPLYFQHYAQQAASGSHTTDRTLCSCGRAVAQSCGRAVIVAANQPAIPRALRRPEARARSELYLLAQCSAPGVWVRKWMCRRCRRVLRGRMWAALSLSEPSLCISAKRARSLL